MSKVQVSSVIKGDNSLDQSAISQEVTSATENTDIVELEDEQLNNVAGGSQDYVAVNDGCFSIDNGGFATGNSGSVADNGGFAVGGSGSAADNSGFAINDGCFSI